jgi:hypothetical protein
VTVILIYTAIKINESEAQKCVLWWMQDAAIGVIQFDQYY